jgi:plastocyanin
VRRSLTILAVIAVLAVGACSGSAATPAPSTAPSAAPTAAPATAAPSTAPSAAPASAGGAGSGVDVKIKNFTFSPASLDAKVGDKVTWTNGDDVAHTVTFDDAANGGSGSLNNGNSFEMTFDKAGTYAYHCKIHPSMKGTVTVS